MLELVLTRPGERSSLVEAAQGLKFLVLDELHTYRGRQGADVAMLVRRVRDACKATDTLQCVGTSATMSSGGTVAEQQREVAAVASRIFGTDGRADQRDHRDAGAGDHEPAARPSRTGSSRCRRPEVMPSRLIPSSPPGTTTSVPIRWRPGSRTRSASRRRRDPDGWSGGRPRPSPSPRRSWPT